MRVPASSALAMVSICRSSMGASESSIFGSRRMFHSSRIRSASDCIRFHDTRAAVVGSRPAKRFSAMVRFANTEGRWYTQATRCCQALGSDAGGAASPKKLTVPVSGVSSPVIMRRSVDLPAPLRPISPCTCPGRIETETSCRAFVAP